ncbi:MAG TPA: YpdA family putative bacillithiol disulfide reductase [Gemmatimonadaceae bacterium]|nr:YpdA family putative bacillithiol disulfide reductase [Gemmatimonadaceae bacterium]
MDTDVVIVGAGPCGLAAAIACTKAGLQAVVFDRSCVVSGIAGYPTYMTFFSTADRLSIGGVPFVVPTEKPSRRDALAYYRALVTHFGLQVRQYEPVARIERERGGFVVHTAPREGGSRRITAHAVVIATGYFGKPNRLGVPGEELPHVTHRFAEGHEAFGRPAVVVGGGNSAVAAALDLHRAGADTTLVHFGPTFDRNIKPWVLPEIEARIAEDAIHGRWNARVSRIEPDAVVVTTPAGEQRIRALHVYLMVGYMPETMLLEQLGVPIDPATGIPTHDPATMETQVPGVFIAGVLASGNDANKTFIENGRGHGDLIARALARTIRSP